MGRRPLPIDWDAQPLGEEPDAAIAERLGCAAATVTDHRRRRGIEPCRRRRNAEQRDRQYREAGAGVDPDSLVAWRLGVTPATVYWWRNRHGVASPNPRPKHRRYSAV